MPFVHLWRLVAVLWVSSVAYVAPLGASPSPAPPPPARYWLSADFFVDAPALPLARVPRPQRPRAHPTDCRRHIGTALCVAAERSGGPWAHADLQARRCEADDGRYRRTLEAVYDRLDPTMQRMVCGIETLLIEPHLRSIAYAGMRGAGAIVGLRRSVFDAETDLQTVISAKEQLPFGGEPDAYAPRDDLPNFEVDAPQPAVETVLYYVLTHELAHLYDFANEVSGHCLPGEVCAVRADSFAALSWKDTATPLASSDFFARERICYYDCDAVPLPKQTIAPLYAGLQRSNFIDMYASTNIFDDFAQTVTYTLLRRRGDVKVRLNTAQGATYDLMIKVDAPHMATKVAWVSEFLRRADLNLLGN